jgi:hypothetical protein
MEESKIPKHFESLKDAFEEYSRQTNDFQIKNNPIDNTTKKIFESKFLKEKITQETVTLCNLLCLPLLSIAIACHAFEYAFELIEQGIDFRIRDCSQRDALYYAIMEQTKIKKHLGRDYFEDDESDDDDDDYDPEEEEKRLQEWLDDEENEDSDLDLAHEVDDVISDEENVPNDEQLLQEWEEREHEKFDEESNPINKIDLEDDEKDETYLACKQMFKHLADLQTREDLNYVYRDGTTILNKVFVVTVAIECKLEPIEYLIQKGATFGPNNQLLLKNQLNNLAFLSSEKYFRLLLDNLTNEQIEHRDHLGNNEFLDTLHDNDEKKKKWIKLYFASRNINIGPSFVNFIKDLSPLQRNRNKKEKALYYLSFPTFSPFKIHTHTDDEIEKIAINNNAMSIFRMYKTKKQKYIKRNRILFFSWVFKNKL